MYTHIVHSRVNDKMIHDSNIQKTVDACIASTSNKMMFCNNYVCITIDDTVSSMVLHVLLNVGEECVTRFMARDHNPSAINHVKYDLTNIKWFIVAPWPTSSCALTFDDVC